MKKLNIIILILSVISVIVVIYQQQRQAPMAQKLPLFMPNLRNQLNDISKITLQSNDEKVTIKQQQNGGWVVVEQDNYPANMQELRKMLLYLSQSELRAAKTNKPELFNRLSLDDLQGKKMQIFASDTMIYDVVIGATTGDFSGTYVRTQGDNQSYKTSGDLQFATTPEKWLDFNFISIAPERVQSINYTFNGKKPYQYTRQNAEDAMQLSPAPDGELIIGKETMRNPATYFERLAFTAVKTTENAALKGDITTMTTFDGLQIEIEFYEIEFAQWVKISAHVDVKTRDKFATSPLKPLAEVEAEAQNINQLTKGWIYQLGQFQQQNLSRSYLDLTEIKLD